MILYLFYLTTLMLCILIVGRENTLVNNEFTKGLLNIALLIVSIYMVYITDVKFVDRDVYTELFSKVSRLPVKEVFETYSYEPLFLLVTKLISNSTQNESIYYVLLYFVFVVILLKGLTLIVGKGNSVYAFMFFLHFWVFYEYVLNGLRQGLAMAFILLAIGYALEKKSMRVIFSSVAAALFHYSSFPIAVFVIFLNYKRNGKVSYLLALFILFSIAYLLGLNQVVFSHLHSSLLENYSDDALIESYGGSNKVKFLFFNVLFFIAFSLHHRANKENETFTFLYKLYILFSLYFMAFGFIAFSNRVSAYSWFLIPVITAYIATTTKSKFVVLGIILAVVLTGYLTKIYKNFYLY